MQRSSPANSLLRRTCYRLAFALSGVALVVTPLSAQSVTQQGWNPKEILANDKYVKPPEVVAEFILERVLSDVPTGELVRAPDA